MTQKGLIVSSIIVAVISFLGAEKLASLSSELEQDRHNMKELQYYKEATLLTDCLYREGTPVSTKVIKETLEAIDAFLPKYFPNGPYTREDFIAMAWLESGFDKYSLGTHSEKGIFQIMPDEFHDNHITQNKYDIKTNTKICMTVLLGKFHSYPDYKKAIIAYNGVVRLKGGRWSEKYWKSFERRREMVEVIFNENN
jgi:hypothetical protein